MEVEHDGIEGLGFTNWAFEHDENATKSFKLNHPNTEVYHVNCAVMLRNLIKMHGNIDDCIFDTKSASLQINLNKDQKEMLPHRGEVELNRWEPSQETTEKKRENFERITLPILNVVLHFTVSLARIQEAFVTDGNDLIHEHEWNRATTLLSYVDFLQPNFFLLESDKKLVTLPTNQIFRLTISTLLHLGYQVSLS
ncbi:DNA (cytosine-5)-methyltransferase 4-like [Amborella trichopoda]|uniref:DNA (cytosine-5)-methyltransferase 4-like n=1 Tax=Amborella trichopoda TaxID=13333 RepID=UPI0009BE1E81|nr:DNA (cytosine-5)-methyltransferase 4-like [Amborella trichopoda]|eukprot:XP_020527266.1 DNA (cytosine-5)-methyltransferase 4-like [Amborella trichopoda]